MNFNELKMNPNEQKINKITSRLVFLESQEHLYRNGCKEAQYSSFFKRNGYKRKLIIK